VFNKGHAVAMILAIAADRGIFFSVDFLSVTIVAHL